jgi:hypothetical protein
LPVALQPHCRLLMQDGNPMTSLYAATTHLPIPLMPTICRQRQSDRQAVASVDATPSGCAQALPCPLIFL